MKALKALLFALCVTLTSFSAIAQDEKIGDVDLSFLKGETKFNIVYNYDKMMVEDKTEDQYKKDKMAKYDEKEPGKGKRWEEKWINARQLAYEPNFEELLSKFVSKEGASAVKGAKDAKYTIYVKTVKTDPGFNAVVMKRNPHVDFEISWKETATGKVLAKADVGANGVIYGGSQFDFDPTNSIKEAYAKAGKVVGKAIAKALKK